MVELWAVIVLIVGIVMTFVGAFMALTSSSLRKPVDALHMRVDRHDVRLGDLEKQTAVRDAQMESIIVGVAEIKRLFEKHMDAPP